MASIAIPAFAHNGVVHAVTGSTTGMMRTASTTSTTADRLANMQKRGDTEIENRIDNLTKLIARLTSSNNINATQAAAISAELQGEITNLNAIKARIDSATSTAGIQNDLKDVIGGSRVYVLVMPQANITAAADRALNVVTIMNTVLAKLQTRVSADTLAATSTVVQGYITDAQAKLGDATTQANTAISTVAALTPDNGDKTKQASNLAALKTARTAIQKAQQDIVAARKDIRNITKTLAKNDRGLDERNENASSTPGSSNH